MAVLVGASDPQLYGDYLHQLISAGSVVAGGGTVGGASYGVQQAVGGAQSVAHAGELLAADELILNIGGCASNAAMNLAKLGVRAAICGKVGIGGGVGHVIEYQGEAIRDLSMEGRMTLCNMTIEAGARAGLIAPDETTFKYIAGRPRAPKGAQFENALLYWRTLKSDADAKFDVEIVLDAAEIPPMVTWGTSPEVLEKGIALGRQTRQRYGSGLDVLQKNLKSGAQVDLIEASKKRSMRVW